MPRSDDHARQKPHGRRPWSASRWTTSTLCSVTRTLKPPIEETVRAMSYLVDNGYAFYWCTSEWSAQQIRHAHEVARREHLVPPTMEQPQYNMLHRERMEREYAPLYEDIGLGTTTWSPLASGLLTGKYNDGIPDDSRLAMEGYEWLQDQLLVDEQLDEVRQLLAVAEVLDCTTAQLALAWCLLNDDVSTVITGASKPHQVEENMQALDVVDQLGTFRGNRPLGRRGPLCGHHVARRLQPVGGSCPHESRRRTGERIGVLRFENRQGERDWNSILLQVTEPIRQKLIVEPRPGLGGRSLDDEMSGREAVQRTKRLVAVLSSPLYVGEKIFAVGEGAHDQYWEVRNVRVSRRSRRLGNRRGRPSESLILG